MKARRVVGRDSELEAIASFLARVVGRPSALLLQGEAGIGKSTLWQAGVDGASSGFCVLTARCGEAERELSFAGLADLLGGAADRVLAALPPPQCRALSVALLLEDADAEDPPDPRAIAAAFLGALRELGRGGPVLVALDDVQWLDAASAAVVAYAVRRLEQEPVGLLLAQRVSGTTLVPLGLDRALAEECLSRVPVGPLSVDALHRVIRDRTGIVLPPPTLLRVHRASSGNPFYALEIARSLQRRGTSGLWVEEFELPTSLLQLVSDRLGELPQEANDALAAAAALAAPTTLRLEAAIPGSADGIAAAAARGVVEVEGDRLRFTHPLLAAAAEARAGRVKMRRLHRRLAEVVADPEQRARHLALGVHEPDEPVAALLEEAAARAAARGAPEGAAALAERAAELTPPSNPPGAAARMLAAATYHVRSGDFDRAASLVEGVQRGEGEGGARELLVRLAQIRTYQGRSDEARHLLQRLLDDASGEKTLQARALLQLSEFGSKRLALERTRAAVVLAEEAGDDVLLAEALAGAGWIEAHLGGDFVPLFERAVGLGGPDSALHARTLLAARMWFRDELQATRPGLIEHHAAAAERGDLITQANTATTLSELYRRAGEFGTALRYGQEALALSEADFALRGPLAYVTAFAHALLGQLDEASALAKRGLEFVEQGGLEYAQIQNRWVLGFVALSTGEIAEAADWLRPLPDLQAAIDFKEPTALQYHPDAIEALLAAGEEQSAHELLDWLDRRAPERPWARAACARCRGLAHGLNGDLEAATASFRSALAEYSTLPRPFERARTMLALGTTLRRTKQRGAARDVLTETMALFDTLGAARWAEKAAAELARVSGCARSSHELTETERRIAELVAGGLSNKEVAATLFVAVRTVEANLSKIYAKLGVRSRTELASRLTRQAHS